MDLSNITAFISSHKRILVVVLTICVLLLVASRYGTISVEVIGAGDGELTYQFSKQGAGGEGKATPGKGKISRLVTSGHYEIQVSQNNTSGFVVSRAKGFFRKTTVKLSLRPELDRRFVGDNPDPCAYYDGNLLYSYNCGGLFSKLKVHVPASPNQPTYTITNSGGVDGNIEGLIKTSEGNLLLMKRSSEEESSAQVAYLVSPTLGLDTGVVLTGLDPETTYSLKPYREGFVVYSQDFEQIYYYPSRIASPETIAISRPKDSEQLPVTLSTDGNKLVFTFSNNTQGETGNQDALRSKGSKSEVMVYENAQTKQFSFKKELVNAVPCGEDKLCTLGNKELQVFNISGKQARQLYSIERVSEIAKEAEGLLVAREKELIHIDTNTRSGYRQYSYGDLQFCGLSPRSGGKIVCLISNGQKKVALNVENTPNISSDIDKKLSQLLDIEGVDDVSIYGNIIYISPNLGNLVFNSSTGYYDYDPARIAFVNEQINKALTGLGIDRSKYLVIVNN